MTPEQYERWQDFSKRMATTCYAGDGYPGTPSGQWVLDGVESFFDCLDPLDIQVIRSWDNTDDYPEGHPYYHAQTFEWGTRYDSGPGVGDLFQDHEENGWSEIAEEMPKVLWKRYERARDTDDYDCEDGIRRDWSERYFGPVGCCIRAGLDMACEPSAGVIGFSAGDIRRMYPEGVPEWAFPPGQRLSYWPTGEPDGFFEDLPDDAVMAL